MSPITQTLMKSEKEIQDWRDKEVERLNSIVDEKAKWIQCIVIDILNEVLDE